MNNNLTLKHNICICVLFQSIIYRLQTTASFSFCYKQVRLSARSEIRLQHTWSPGSRVLYLITLSSTMCTSPPRFVRARQLSSPPPLHVHSLHTWTFNTTISVKHGTRLMWTWSKPTQFFHFSLPAQEPKAKPPNLTEDIEKKKQKKQKKMSNIHSSITGFEEAFEQFATSGIKNSKNTMVTHPEVGNPLTPRQSDIPADNKLDVSATQVWVFSSKSLDLFFE